jgi:hypothetical protein
MRNICGEEWASSLGKIIAGRSNVMLMIQLFIWPTPPPSIVLQRRCAESYWNFPIGIYVKE